MSSKGRRRAGARTQGKGKGKGPPAQQEDEPQPSLARRTWDQIGPLVVAVAIALSIRAMVIESYYVPSESMLPTLLIGDHVFVNKFVYGARVPFTDVALPAIRAPERGEIVVFAARRKEFPAEHRVKICPVDECPDYPVAGFVKRIAAIPGDRVEIRDGVFMVNGEPALAPETGETFIDNHGRELLVKRENLTGCVHETLDLPGSPGLAQAAYTIPEGRYYVLGDNRDNSHDSRGWGTVRRQDLKGPIIINYWSWNNQESWLAMLNPLTWARLLFGEMRWGRIGMTHACEEAD